MVSDAFEALAVFVEHELHHPRPTRDPITGAWPCGRYDDRDMCNVEQRGRPGVVWAQVVGGWAKPRWRLDRPAGPDPIDARPFSGLETS